MQKTKVIRKLQVYVDIPLVSSVSFIDDGIDDGSYEQHLFDINNTIGASNGSYLKNRR